MFALALSMFAVAAPAVPADPCKGSSTYEMNECLAGKLKAAEDRLREYEGAAINRHTDKEGKFDSVALGIRSAQTAFDAYREIECGTVYEDWSGGTIRGVMSLGCKIKLTDERTYTVWSNWLQYMDSTPPILPEPKPTK